MKVLLDENFPISAIDTIIAAGHEPIQFADIRDYGDDDEIVFSTAQKQKALILTSDRDFYHTVPLLHPMHCGIVVIALRQPNRLAILQRLEWFFAHYDAPYDNQTFILRDYSCQKRN